MAYLSLDLLGEHAHPRRGWTPVNLSRRTGQRRNLMIEVDLTAAAFELVRDGVIAKSRKSGMYKVLMPKNLAAHLDAARVSGEGMSDVILRLAREAKTPAKPAPLR
jgi:hypothetical protein